MSPDARHSSGGPWEDSFGYSRAVRTGRRILVSGCTAVRDGVLADGDPAGQARAAMQTAIEAVEALGGTLADVVRTRMYLVHRVDAPAVGEVHREVFGEVRPAATMVVVESLLEPELLVEVEVEAELAATPPQAVEAAP